MAKYAARIPDDLYEKARTVATSKGMSFNSFLNSAIGDAVASEDQLMASANIAGSGLNLRASYASPTTANYVFVTSEDSLSDVIAQLSTGESHGEEAEEGTEAG